MKRVLSWLSLIGLVAAFYLFSIFVIFNLFKFYDAFNSTLSGLADEIVHILGIILKALLYFVALNIAFTNTQKICESIRPSKKGLRYSLLGIIGIFVTFLLSLDNNLILDYSYYLYFSCFALISMGHAMRKNKKSIIQKLDDELGRLFKKA